MTGDKKEQVRSFVECFAIGTSQKEASKRGAVQSWDIKGI